MSKKYQCIQSENCKQAVIFARVSSKEQEPGASLDAQHDIMAEYCQKRGLAILKKYRVIESSTVGKRTKFNEMLEFVRKQKQKTAIVVHCIDRFQRRFNECVAVEGLLKEDKIELHFYKEGLILNQNSSSADIMRWDMGILSAKMYIASMRDNVNRSMNYNWSLGKWQGRAPIGYLNTRDETNKATVIADPERAPIVKKLFEEYATGCHSLRSIWKLAQEMNLDSFRSKTKKSISRVTVYNMLTNPFYYGEMIVKGQVIPHIYEPLIDKSLFDKVQDLLSGKKIHCKEQVYGGLPFAFRGLIKCAHCGCTLSEETHKKTNGKTYTYLRCGRLKGPCDQELVSESVILNQLDEEVFSKIRINSDIVELLKKNIQQRLIDEEKVNAVMKRQITNEIEKLNVRERRVKDVFFDGGIDRSEWKEEKANIEAKRKELQKTIEKYADITQEIKDTVNDILDIVASASMIMKTSDPLQKRELHGLLLSDCYLDGQKLIYKIQKPFDKLLVGSKFDGIVDFHKENIAAFSSLVNDIHVYHENMKRLAAGC